ncbi:MAG: hypothetical protein HYR85_15690 [Planctomycetes bacterium]|nr:hypothetical protein [Planctomycetota bacterium]MBI3848126.1 hypothetical protein [Planctomycetota bacterium]
MHVNRTTRAGMCVIGILGVAGCSTLDIQVDVYKGSLVNSREAELVEAVGLARDIYQSYGSPNSRANVLERDEYPDQMWETIRIYEEDGIENLWAKYQGMPCEPADWDKLSSTASPRTVLRAQLARGLCRFAGALISAGQGKGVGPEVQLSHPSVIGVSESDKKRLAHGIALEESGRRIFTLVDDSMDSSDRTSISRLMQNVSLGLLGGNAAELLGLKGYFDKASWSEINTINVGGFGTTQYVLIKDEIGNWHIKTVVTDSSEVIAAMFDSVSMAVNLVGQAYGVPIPAANDAQGTQPAAERNQESTHRALESERADRAARRLRDLNGALRSQLQTALNETEVTKRRQMVHDAVLTYAALAKTPAPTEPPSTAATPAPK